jgi:hypothetical protein
VGVGGLDAVVHDNHVRDPFGSLRAEYGDALVNSYLRRFGGAGESEKSRRELTSEFQKAVQWLDEDVLAMAREMEDGYL